MICSSRQVSFEIQTVTRAKGMFLQVGVEKMTEICFPPTVQNQRAASVYGPGTPSQLCIFLVDVTNIFHHLYTVTQALLAEADVALAVFCLSVGI